MKKLFTLFFLIFTLTIYSQTSTPNWYTDISIASETAVAENKPMLILFTGSDWCSWCIRLQREVFSRESFTTWSKQNVILVEIDFPKYKEQPDNIVQQNKLLQEQFGIQGYPTVWFVTVNKIDDTIVTTLLGQSGYIPGGPQSWIDNANSIINGDK